jgi:hypothetical protein
MISRYSLNSSVTGSGVDLRIGAGARSSQKLLSILYDIFEVSVEVLTLYLRKEVFSR